MSTLSRVVWKVSLPVILAGASETFLHVIDTVFLARVGVVELVSDKATKAAGGYLDQVGPRLTKAFLDRGLLLRPLGNIVYFMPPYVISESETCWALDQIASVLQDSSLFV